MNNSTNLNGTSENHAEQNNGTVNGEPNSFEVQFRNLITTPIMKDAQTGGVNSLDSKETNYTVAAVILMILVGTGAIGIILAAVTLFRKTLDNNNMIEYSNGPQDDEGAYKDLSFDDKSDSNTPLLVYLAAKENKTADMEWLEDFKKVSKKYVNEYDGVAIPDDAEFSGEVTTSDAESKLFPNQALKRILIYTSSGCARFDFYDSLLVIHDYEFSIMDCAVAKWNFLKD